MKILVDFQDDTGGAPRSHLEHAKALQQSGHEIIAVIQPKSKEFLQGSGFTLNTIESFRKKGYLKKLKIGYQYYKLINKIKPDIIYANRSSQCIYLSFVSDITGIPIICSRAGGNNISNIHKINKDRHYIVYSEELYQEFIGIGFEESKVHLIQNRIRRLDHVDEISNNIKSSNVNILFIGNIKRHTINGVKWFLEFLHKNINNIQSPLSVNFAGELIGVRDDDKDRIYNKVQSINKSGIHVKCNLMGWVNDISSLISETDICIGKGRSVIQPMMNHKMGYVISEHGAIYDCNLDNYDAIKKSNFTGRGLEKSKCSGDKLIKSINNYQFDVDNKLTKSVIEDYSVDYLNNKIEPVIFDSVRCKKVRVMSFTFRLYKYFYHKIFG